MRLHPGLPEMYRAKVVDLAASLRDATIRTRALDVLRGLIERVTVRSDDTGKPVLELEGAITAMIEEAQPGALRRGPETGTLVIDEDEAAIVRRIFREYVEGRSPLKIAAGLNADLIPSPAKGTKRKTSGHWKQNTINGNPDAARAS